MTESTTTNAAPHSSRVSEPPGGAAGRCATARSASVTTSSPIAPRQRATHVPDGGAKSLVTRRRDRARPPCRSARACGPPLPRAPARPVSAIACCAVRRGPLRAAARSGCPRAACERRTPSRRRSRPKRQMPLSARRGARRGERGRRAFLTPSSAPLRKRGLRLRERHRLRKRAEREQQLVHHRQTATRAGENPRDPRARGSRATSSQARDGRAARSPRARSLLLELRASAARNGSLAISASSARSSGAIHGSAKTPSAGTCSDHCSAEPTARSAAPSLSAANSRAGSRPASTAPGWSFAASRASPVSTRGCDQRSAALPSGSAGPAATETLSSAAGARIGRCNGRRRRTRRAPTAQRATRNASRARRIRAAAIADGRRRRRHARRCYTAPSRQSGARSPRRANSAARACALRRAADPVPAARTRTSARRSGRSGATLRVARTYLRDDVRARVPVAVAIADGEYRMPRRRPPRRTTTSTTCGCRGAARSARRPRATSRRVVTSSISLTASMSPARSALPDAATHAQHARKIVRLSPRVGVVLVVGEQRARSARRPIPTAGRSRQRSAAALALRARRSGCRRAARTRARRPARACSTDSAPPLWSRSLWLTIIMSSERMPAARRYGTTMRLPASAVSCQRGPGVVEKRVRMRLDDDRRSLPDVERRQRNAPGARRRRPREEHRDERERGRAQRPGTPRGARQSSDAGDRRRRPPTRAARAAPRPRHRARPAPRARASADRAAHAPHATARRTEAAPRRASAARSRTSPAGSRRRSPAGPISDTCWKKASDSGTSPIVIAHCACAAARSCCNARASDPGGATRRQPPAADVDQHADREERQPEARREHRPGIPREHGRERPASRPASRVPGRPIQRPSADTASIASVRCAGTSAPASST